MRQGQKDSPLYVGNYLRHLLARPESRQTGRCTTHRIVAIAAEQALAARCEWLHVDFEEHLRSFYMDSCGFRPTQAGLIAL
jgi:hypothetical protein